MGLDVHLERGETQNVHIFSGQNGGVLFLRSQTEAGRGSDPRFYVTNELLNVQKEIYGRNHKATHHTCSCSQASVVFLSNATVIYQRCAGTSHNVPESRWHQILWRRTENVEGSRFLEARGVPHMPRGNYFWSREHCSDWGADGGGRKGWIPLIKASLSDEGKLTTGNSWSSEGLSHEEETLADPSCLPLHLHIRTITVCSASWLIMSFSWWVSLGKTNTFIVIRGGSADQLKEREQFGNLNRPHPNLR